MSKIKLGNTPKTFKKTVKFPMLDGTQGAMGCVYKYRTRTQFGTFIDGIIEAAGSAVKADDEKFSMAALMEKTAASNADYVMDVLDGWDLDIALDHASVKQLADELPAAVTAIMEDYRIAITEGRLGN